MVLEYYRNSLLIYKDGRKKTRAAKLTEILNSILQPKGNNFKTLEDESIFY